MRLRGIGILAVLAMMLAFAAPVAADHTTPISLGASGTDQSGLCTGDYFKIEEASVLVAGTHNYAGTTKLGVAFTATITTVITGGEVDSITVVSTNPPTALIVVKAGNEFFDDTLNPEQGISDVAFCLTVATPTLSLEKIITGGAAGDDEIDFDFTLSGAASGTFTTDANDPALLLASASGTFTITEGAESGWTLNNIACTGGTDVTTTATSITVTVGTDADVVCTFTNGKVTTTVVTQSLMLEKVVSSGDANTEFGFSFGASGTTPAALANTVSANDAAVLLSTTAGSYVIAESALAGWNLTGINCLGNAADETASVSIANRQVTIVVGAGENVTCTFTNAPTGTLAGNPVVRTGTLAGVPNTAMDAPLNDGMPTVLITVLALAGLAYAGHRNLVAMRAHR